MQALNSYQRMIYRQGAFLSNADLSTNPSFSVNLHGFALLKLFVVYTRNGGGAATAVTFSGTSTHANIPSTNCKITGASQAGGTVTRSAWTDTYAVTASDAWQVEVPIVAGNAIISVSAAGSNTNDRIDVYVVEAQ
jgi:hypothetical protein